MKFSRVLSTSKYIILDSWILMSILMPLTTPTILLGFLLLWTWDISSRLLQQSAAAAPYLGRGVSPHSCPSWPWTWSSSSRPSCACAATAPWTWGCSSLYEVLFFFMFFVFKKKKTGLLRGTISVSRLILFNMFIFCLFPLAWLLD